MISSLLLLAAGLATVVDAEPLSPLLAARFSCDRCWPTRSPNVGTTDWCLCCFFNCGGFRADCFTKSAFCTDGRNDRCAGLDICDRYGGVPPAGALPGAASSFFEADGTTLKKSSLWREVREKHNEQRHTSDDSSDSEKSYNRVKKCPRGYKPELIDFNDGLEAGVVEGRVPAVFGDSISRVSLNTKCYGGSKSLENLWLFDSDGDYTEFGEWLSPNAHCPNPGLGAGTGGEEKRDGKPNPFANCEPIDNSLVLLDENHLQCAEGTDLTLTFKEPVYVRFATVLNVQKGTNRDAMLSGYVGAAEKFKERFPAPGAGKENARSTLNLDADELVGKLGFWFAEPLAIVEIGVCKKQRDEPEPCDNDLVCPSSPQTPCVHDRCKKLDWTEGGRGRGRCENNNHTPCKGDKDGPCVCKNDPKKACVPKPPATMSTKSSTTTSTPTSTPTLTPTSTPTPTPTSTPTPTPTSAPTPTPTATPTSAPTPTPTSAPTSTPESTPTSTPTSTPESTPTSTPSSTPESTPSENTVRCCLQGSCEDLTQMECIARSGNPQPDVPAGATCQTMPTSCNRGCCLLENNPGSLCRQQITEASCNATAGFTKVEFLAGDCCDRTECDAFEVFDDFNLIVCPTPTPSSTPTSTPESTPTSTPESTPSEITFRCCLRGSCEDLTGAQCNVRGGIVQPNIPSGATCASVPTSCNRGCCLLIAPAEGRCLQNVTEAFCDSSAFPTSDILDGDCCDQTKCDAFQVIDRENNNTLVVCPTSMPTTPTATPSSTPESTQTSTPTSTPSSTPESTPAPITFRCCLQGACADLTVAECQASGGNVIPNEPAGATCQTAPNSCNRGCCVLQNPSDIRCLQNITRGLCETALLVEKVDLFSGSCCDRAECDGVQVVDQNEVNVECPAECEAETRCGERPGCYGGVHDGLMCRTLEDCVGGYKCVPTDCACRNDAPCQDCNEDGDDKRAHQCGPCRYCSAEERRDDGNNHTAYGLPCCPFLDKIKLRAKLVPANFTFDDIDYKAAASGSVTIVATLDEEGLFCFKVTESTEPFPLTIFFTQLRAVEDFDADAPALDVEICITLEDYSEDFSRSLSEAFVVAFVDSDDDQALGAQFQTPDDRSFFKKPKQGECSDDIWSSGSCRPRLDCSCGKCSDECDHNFDGNDTLLPADWFAVPLPSAPVLSIVSGFEFVDQCTTPSAGRRLDEDFCRTAVKKSCTLAAGEWRHATIEPHIVAGEACVDPVEFDKIAYDIYRIFAAQRLVSVVLETRVADCSSSTPASSTEVAYLVSANDWCAKALPVRAELHSVTCEPHPKGGDLQTTKIDFRAPTTGHYLLVVTSFEHVAFANATRIPEEDRQQLRCVDYRVKFEAMDQVCPPELCELAPCRDARDCDAEKCTDFTCAADYGRCILSETRLDGRTSDDRAHDRWRDIIANPDWDDDDDGGSKDSSSSSAEGSRQKKPKKSGVCAYQPDGAPCVGVVGDQCQQTTCQSGACKTDVRLPVFNCDCVCPPQCDSYLDCDDHDPTTTDLCEPDRGVCLHRKRPAPEPTPTPGELFCPPLEIRTTIVENCTTTTALQLTGVCAANGTCIASLEVGGEPPSRVDRQCANTTTPCGAENTACTCSGWPQPVCTRSIGPSQGAVLLVLCQVAPEAPEPSVQRAAVVSADADERVSEASVRSALDRAELAYTAAVFDVYGDNSAAGSPLCASDVEERTIEIDSGAAQQAASDECEAVDAAQECLDGQTEATSALGHQWFDRAWRSLDAASRHAQRQPTSRRAMVSACCAQLYYGALARWCGRSGADADHWQLSDARVVREAVGADCVAFDDGHRDRDINDWVAEQRVVEVRAANGELRAINVHVVPLARGGGYTASYALSARGLEISSLGAGANAGCSERARAVLDATFDPTAIRSELERRVPLADGVRVAVFHHVLAAESADAHVLPAGVSESFCVTLTDGAEVPPYCRAQAAGDVALFDNTRSTLPPATEASLYDELVGVSNYDNSINTRRDTRRYAPLYGASAVLTLPEGARDTVVSADNSLRFALRNHDCGAAVLLGSSSSSPSPLAVRVPAAACSSWRWSAEGVALIEDARSDAQQCRGGTEGGILECSSAADGGVCESSGGECATAPRTAGVPYEYAARYFACSRCNSRAACESDASCAGNSCCDALVLEWYRHAGAADLLYRPARALADVILSGANDE